MWGWHWPVLLMWEYQKLNMFPSKVLIYFRVKHPLNNTLFNLAETGLRYLMKWHFELRKPRQDHKKGTLNLWLTDSVNVNRNLPQFVFGGPLYWTLVKKALGMLNIGQHGTLKRINTSSEREQKPRTCPECVREISEEGSKKTCCECPIKYDLRKLNQGENATCTPSVRHRNSWWH